MHYLIGRDLDADGRYEFIKDMQNMILTEDPYRALQVSEYDLTYIDMEYLRQYGFYALEASRFQVSLLERLLFRPRTFGFRPPIVPPPRRAPLPRRRLHTPPRLQPFHDIAPRPAAAPRPAPRPAGPMGRPAARPGGLFDRSPSRAPKPGGRGPGGRGGRGFGR